MTASSGGAGRDLAGTTAVVTGASSGIGAATAMGLAARGAGVILTCRSETRAKVVLEAMEEAGAPALGVVTMDLGNLASIRGAVENLAARRVALDVLVNNAGVAGARGFTDSGFELAFGTNHIGHFLFTTALLDRLGDRAPRRVVTVASDAHSQARGIDFDAVRRPTRSLTGLPEYAVSKLANVLFSQALATRVADRGITTYALHPGVIASDIWRRVPWPLRPIMTLFMKSPEEGARTSLYCATAPELAHDSGRYYVDSAVKAPSEHCTPELAEELWRRSEEWTAS